MHSQAPPIPCSHQFVKKPLFCYLFCAELYLHAGQGFQNEVWWCFFTRSACICAPSLLPRVLPAGWEKVPKGKAGGGSLQGSGLEGKTGKSRGGCSIEVTVGERACQYSRMGDHGRKPLPTYCWRSLRAHKRPRGGGRQDGWEGRRALGDKASAALPHSQPPGLVLGFQSRRITMSWLLASKYSLYHLSLLHLPSLQTLGSILDPAGSIPDLSVKHHSLENKEIWIYLLQKRSVLYWKPHILFKYS